MRRWPPARAAPTSAYARFLTWTGHGDFATGGATDDATLTKDLAAIGLVLLIVALVAGVASGIRAALVGPARALRAETG